MAGEWRQVPLQELTEYLNRGAAPLYVDEGGILVVNQKCIRDQRVDFGLARRTDSTQRLIARERIIKNGDILVNSTGVGTLGRVAQVRVVPDTATVDSHVTLVRPAPEVVDARYLGYAMKLRQPEIEALGHGSTGQTELSRARLGELLLPVAPRGEQEVIAAILGALDDKIELNRRMSETLEEMARALFDKWVADVESTSSAQAHGRLDDFIEFDPPEVLGRGSISPYLGLADIPTSGMVHDPPSPRPYSSGSRFRDGDTLFARITPSLENGKSALVSGLGRGTVGWGSTEFIVMRAKEPVPPLVPYLIARDPTFRAYAAQNMSGTSGRQRVPRTVLERYPFAVVNDASWTLLRTRVDCMADAIWAREMEARTLSELRDALLPKLISGELRVPDAERLVSEVA